MSVQFGRCNFDSKPIDPRDFDQIRPVLARYGPDGEGSFCSNDAVIIYRALYTTRESRDENQPYITASGKIVAWDGRLDNREQLIQRLGTGLSSGSTDVAIVGGAYELCGTDCFASLSGDWALSVWDPKYRVLILAKDFLGTRHLYYSVQRNQVTWCSILDPFMLLARHSFLLDEEYVAGWLTSFPAPHLTPYVGIQSVPPCSFVCLESGKRTTSRYWEFDAQKRIRYRTDAEYEEHFRTVFGESVRRRLRSDSPTLAELSGGMDSSSIVCMADAAIARGAAETPRLDTVSYYNDSEPNWNERPYFTRVEKERGRAGFHVDVSSEDPWGIQSQRDGFFVAPGGCALSSESARRFSDCATQGYRVLLSGIGGDEMLGGVPNPVPELADLLVRARLCTLAKQSYEWALTKRQPVLRLQMQVVRAFLPPRSEPAATSMLPWLNPEFARRNQSPLRGYDRRLTLFGGPPSFQSTMQTLDGLRRQLSCAPLNHMPVLEKSYPLLDRDLLDFLVAVPRNQLLRPSQRRSLMRRALVGIVPDAILQRRRKAFVSRAFISALCTNWTRAMELSHNMACDSFGFLDAKQFRDALERLRRGCEVPVVPLMRAILLELWLRGIAEIAGLTPPGLRFRPVTPIEGAGPALAQFDTHRPQPAENQSERR